VYVNTRHVFGAKCSPAIATNAIRTAVKRTKPDLLDTVIQEVYMDDFCHSAPTSKEAIRVGKEVREAMGESSFCLRKWISNSKEILAEFPPEDLAPPFVDLVHNEEKELPTLKALGLRWNAEADTFGYSTRLKPEPPKNLAQVLGQLASVYDLLQLVGPFIMRAKLLFQQFHLSGKTWKDSLDEDQLKAWMEWVEELPLVAGLTIPRWFGFEPKEPVTLHVFCDASEDGYGAVGIFANKEGVRSFVSAKGRVVNKRRPPTMPRCELQALVIGTRLGETILDQLGSYMNIERLIFWVDSAVVYYWATNRDKDLKDYNVFVANRLGEVFEVLERTKELQSEVRWVDTNNNPADLISRGCSASDFEARFGFWTQGPDFLKAEESLWPIPPPAPAKDVEVKKYLIMATVHGKDEFVEYTDLLDYIQKKIEVLEPTLEQIQATEEGLVKLIQKACFRVEIKQIRQRQNDQRRTQEQGYSTMYFKSGPLQRREVFLDEQGVLRLVTRFAGVSCLAWEEKNPIVLSSGHPATCLLIREYHRRIEHGGSRNTFAAMTKKFSVPWNAVKNEVFRCQVCREHSPLPAQAPLGQLHHFRLEAWGHVFKRTGMDYFGPFIIKGGKKCGVCCLPA
jgi:hypothetical protein